MVVLSNAWDANGAVAEKLGEPPDKCRTQERHVARGQVSSVRTTAQRCQTRRQTLERAAAHLFVADDRDLGGQRRHVLTRGGHDDHRLDRLAQQADDARQHGLAGKRQPRFRPTHTAALPATENDAGDFHDSRISLGAALFIVFSRGIFVLSIRSKRFFDEPLERFGFRAESVGVRFSGAGRVVL